MQINLYQAENVEITRDIKDLQSLRRIQRDDNIFNWYILKDVTLPFAMSGRHDYMCRLF